MNQQQQNTLKRKQLTTDLHACTITRSGVTLRQQQQQQQLSPETGNEYACILDIPLPPVPPTAETSHPPAYMPQDEFRSTNPYPDADQYSPESHRYYELEGVRPDMSLQHMRTQPDQRNTAHFST